MRYFKHYSNARRSESLSILIAEHGLDAYARYWLLLEFLAEEFDGESTSFRYHVSTIRELLRVQSWTKLQLVCNQLSTVRGIALRQNETVLEIEAPILLDLLNRDFKKARSERGQSAVYIKNKIKIKNKKKSSKGTQTKFEHPNNLQDFLAIFDHLTYAHWLSIYQNDQDWINRELEKCYGYFYVQKTGKPSSSVKGWKSRASSWLERGWNSFSKNKPANHSTPQLKNAHLLKMLEETK